MTLPEIALALDSDLEAKRPPSGSVAIGSDQVQAYARWRRRATPRQLLALARGEPIDFTEETDNQAR